MVFKIKMLKTSMLKTRMNKIPRTIFKYEENKCEKKPNSKREYKDYKLFIVSNDYDNFMCIEDYLR